MEDDIVLGINELVHRGLGPTSLTLLDVIQEYLHLYEIRNAFKENKPGRAWLRSFMRRHKLSLNKSATKQFAHLNNASNPFIIYDFYDTLSDEMTRLNILNRPECVFNFDETFLSLQIVVEPTAPVVAGGSMVNVMSAINAAGVAMPPFVVFKGTRIPFNCYAASIIPGTGIGVSPNGLMTGDLFERWFYEHFLKFVKGKGIAPVLLILHEHSNPPSIYTLRKARDNGVSFLKIPAQCTNLMQPLKMGMFKRLETHWETKLNNNASGKIGKNICVEMICDVWSVGLRSTYIKTAFSSTGIFPLDRSKNRYQLSRFDPVKLQFYNQWLELGKPKTEAGEIDLSQIARVNQLHASLFEEDVDVSDEVVTSSGTSTACISPPPTIDKVAKDMTDGELIHELKRRVPDYDMDISFRRKWGYSHKATTLVQKEEMKEKRRSTKSRPVNKKKS